MGFLSSLFGGSSAPTPEIVREMDLGRYFYLLDYHQAYSEFLATSQRPLLAVAELFLFRAWTTQFGFRICSSHPDISECVVYEVVNQSNTLGRAMLAARGIHFERLFSTDYMTLLESRWHEYDNIFIKHQSQEQPLAQFPICGAVAAHCNQQDPIKTMLLATSFLLQLNEIKAEAIRRRILSQ